MNHKEALNKYKETQINTADGGRLVILLYEGAIKNIDEAISQFSFKSYDIVNAKLQRAVDIIDELMVSLNMEVGEISEKLKSLYLYMREKLSEGNLKKDVALLKEVRDLLEKLLSAWRTVASHQENKTKPRKGYSGGISMSG